MFQKGRGVQPIKYKQEVLRMIPESKFCFNGQIGYGAIRDKTGKRISEAYKAAWKCWESAYYKLLANELIDENKPK